MNARTLPAPLELIGAILYWPPFSFVVAVIVAGMIVVVAPRIARAGSRRPGFASARLPGRYGAEHRAIGVTALLIAAAFLIEFILHGYVLTGPDVWWWRFALPIICAVIGIGVVLGLIATRGTTPPEIPVPATARRTWLSFSSRSSLLVAAIALLALIVTTVTAGLASSPNDDGLFVWLAVPIPNEVDIDPLRFHFYGWTYGVPVLVSIAALLPVAWAALDRNSARPFSRPETVTAERGARRITASGVVLLVTASTLLSLAGAWRLVSRGGSVQRLSIDGQNDGLFYDASWRFGDLAIVAGWSAPLLEVIAFTVLIVVAAHRLRAPSASRVPSSAVIEATR